MCTHHINGLSIYPINTYMRTRSVHNIPCRYTLSTHPRNTIFQHTLSTHRITNRLNPSYQHIRYIRKNSPINSPTDSRRIHTLSTHPINLPYYLTLSTHLNSHTKHHTLSPSPTWTRYIRKNSTINSPTDSRRIHARFKTSDCLFVIWWFTEVITGWGEITRRYQCVVNGGSIYSQKSIFKVCGESCTGKWGDVWVWVCE